MNIKHVLYLMIIPFIGVQPGLRAAQAQVAPEQRFPLMQLPTDLLHLVAQHMPSKALVRPGVLNLCALAFPYLQNLARVNSQCRDLFGRATNPVTYNQAALEKSLKAFLQTELAPLDTVVIKTKGQSAAETIATLQAAQSALNFFDQINSREKVDPDWHACTSLRIQLLKYFGICRFGVSTVTIEIDYGTLNSLRLPGNDRLEEGLDKIIDLVKIIRKLVSSSNHMIKVQITNGPKTIESINTWLARHPIKPFKRDYEAYRKQHDLDVKIAANNSDYQVSPLQSEDDFNADFNQNISTPQDYVNLNNVLKAAIKPTVISRSSRLILPLAYGIGFALAGYYSCKFVALFNRGLDYLLMTPENQTRVRLHTSSSLTAINQKRLRACAALCGLVSSYLYTKSDAYAQSMGTLATQSKSLIQEAWGTCKHGFNQCFGTSNYLLLSSSGSLKPTTGLMRLGFSMLYAFTPSDEKLNNYLKRKNFPTIARGGIKFLLMPLLARYGSTLVFKHALGIFR